MIIMTFQLCKIIHLLLILFPIICFSVHSPPRSPSPVSLEPLNFHDDWNSVLGSDYLGNSLPQHDSLQDSNTHHIRSTSITNKDQSTKKRQAATALTPLLSTVKQTMNKRRGGRPKTLTIEQRKENARKSVKEWKIAKKITDPDYAARSERIRRANKNKALGIIDRKVGRPPKQQQHKNPPND